MSITHTHTHTEFPFLDLRFSQIKKNFYRHQSVWTNLGETFRVYQGHCTESPREKIVWKSCKIKKLEVWYNPVIYLIFMDSILCPKTFGPRVAILQFSIHELW